MDPRPADARHENFGKIRGDFDADGQLDSIAPPARSNPTARRRRNHLEFFRNFHDEHRRGAGPRAVGPTVDSYGPPI